MNVSNSSIIFDFIQQCFKYKIYQTEDVTGVLPCKIRKLRYASYPYATVAEKPHTCKRVMINREIAIDTYMIESTDAARNALDPWINAAIETPKQETPEKTPTPNSKYGKTALDHFPFFSPRYIIMQTSVKQNATTETKMKNAPHRLNLYLDNMMQAKPSTSATCNTDLEMKWEK